MALSKEDKLKLCSGCRDDYYNHGGHSASGHCWSLNQAKKVTKMMVGTWQNPPYVWNPQETLSCHHPEGSVWIEKNDCRVVMPEKAEV